MSSVLLLIDSDLSKEEMAIAKHYPAHTALCIKDGWEFCSPDRATGWYSKVYGHLLIHYISNKRIAKLVGGDVISR